MIFNTEWFIVFFLIIYPIFLLLPSTVWRFYFILLASAVFHTHFAGPAGVAPIIVIGVSTYWFGLWLGKQNGPVRPKHFALIRAVAFAIPVLGLVYYKYRSFIFSALVFLPEPWKQNLHPFFTIGPLPLAISFFAFEFVHYLADINKGNKPISSFPQFALFSIFFPSIVSGPIKRYENFTDQIKTGLLRPRMEDIVLGAGQILLGFFKKLAIADTAYLLSQLLEKQARWNVYSVSLLIVVLSIRILFDFSGYSDIAIGLARMLGIRLPINFNFPYLARDISDFWGRWHISLSSWIRDYLYIPLGGGRVPLIQKVFNLLLVMALCGLWHGAALHFILWGIYQGLGLGVHNLYRQFLKSRNLAAFSLPKPVGLVLTLGFVCYGWLIFFYPINKVWELTVSLFRV